MSTSSPERSPIGLLERLKLGAALSVLVAGFVSFYYFEGVVQVYRILGLLAAVLVSGYVFFLLTNVGARVSSFVSDSRAEVRRVVWPTTQEVGQATLFVVVLVALLGVFLWVLDGALIWCIQSVTGQAR